MRTLRTLAALCLLAANAPAQDPSAPYYPPPGTPVVKTLPLNGQATLSWAAVPGALEYKVKRSDAGLLGPFVTVGTAVGTTFTNAGLTNGTTYYYVVAAVNGTSATHSARVGAIPSAAATPLFFDGFESLSKWTVASSANVVSIDADQGKPLPALKIGGASGTMTFQGVVRSLEAARPLTFTADTGSTGGSSLYSSLTVSGGTTVYQATLSGSTLSYSTGVNAYAYFGVAAAPSHVLGFKISSSGGLSWTVDGSTIATSIVLPAGLQLGLGDFCTGSTSGSVWWDNARVTSP
jgi:hypothetical protein